MSSSILRRGFMKHWFAIEAVPIYVLLAASLSGAAWYGVRLARRPEGVQRVVLESQVDRLSVVWTKSNPTPWNTVGQDQTTKLFHGHHKFEKSCVVMCLWHEPC